MKANLLPDSFGEEVKQVVDSVVSTTSPIFSSVGEEEWDSREKREGELEWSWSFADQDGLVPFSLSTNGLAMVDLVENVCRCIPLTAGRLDNPALLKNMSAKRKNIYKLLH